MHSTRGSRARRCSTRGGFELVKSHLNPGGAVAHSLHALIQRNLTAVKSEIATSHRRTRPNGVVVGQRSQEVSGYEPPYCSARPSRSHRCRRGCDSSHAGAARVRARVRYSLSQENGDDFSPVESVLQHTQNSVQDLKTVAAGCPASTECANLRVQYLHKYVSINSSIRANAATRSMHEHSKQPVRGLGHRGAT